MNGRIKRYILEDRNLDHSCEAEGVMPAGLNVWADPGYSNILRAIPGVHNVYVQNETNYYIELDPRYDREQIKKTIKEVLDPSAAVREKIEKFESLFKHLDEETKTYNAEDKKHSSVD